jgi:hypothetical protein
MSNVISTCYVVFTPEIADYAHGARNFDQAVLVTRSVEPTIYLYVPEHGTKWCFTNVFLAKRYIQAVMGSDVRIAVAKKAA